MLNLRLPLEHKIVVLPNIFNIDKSYVLTIADDFVIFLKQNLVSSAYSLKLYYMMLLYPFITLNFFRLLPL